MNRYYLGVDVATSCGWSLLAASPRGKPTRVDGGVLCLGDDPGFIIHIFADQLRPRFSGTNLLDVALEDPYLDENPQTLKVLARFVGRFEQEFAGEAPVLLVPAQTWQTAVLGRLGGRNREQRKKAARLWAKATFDRNLMEDEADATALAYYLATKGRLG